MTVRIMKVFVVSVVVLVVGILFGVNMAQPAPVTTDATNVTDATKGTISAEDRDQDAPNPAAPVVKVPTPVQDSAKLQPGQSQRTFTVKVARYVSNGSKIMAKSELSIKQAIGYVEPEGTITAWIPASLWQPYQDRKIALVGKKIRVTGTLGMIKRDGEEPNEITAVSIELVK